MKKLLILAVALTITTSTASFAQSLEEMEASKAAVEKLVKENKPAKTGMGNVDNLVEEAIKDATNSMEVTNSVYTLYVKAYHPEAGEGNATLEECVVLQKAVKDQAQDLEKVSGLTTKAAEDVKSAKPLSKPKGVSAMNYAKNVYGVLTNELELQTKVLHAVSQKLGGQQ